MTVELQALFWVAATLFVLLAIQGALVPINQGFAWGLGPRDEPRDMTALQGRMRRIVSNHIEGMAVFAALVLVGHLAGVSNGVTAGGAVLYAVSRVAFAAVYMAGLPVVRSVVWGAGVVGLGMIAWEIAAAML